MATQMEPEKVNAHAAADNDYEITGTSQHNPRENWSRIWKERTMDITWQRSITIAAPVERVYGYLADFPKHCEWAQTLEHMEQTRPGTAGGAGAVYKTYERQAFQADRVPGGPMPDKASKSATVCEVTELSPYQRIAWSAHPVPIGLGIHARLAFDFAESRDGGTQLTQSIAMSQPWLPTQLISRVLFKMTPEAMAAKSRAQWDASLENIRAILERPSI